MTTENRVVGGILAGFIALFLAALISVWNETPAERCIRQGGTPISYLQACEYPQGDIQRY